jgi:hypothetical protein
MTSNSALSTVDDVLAVADRFFGIADMLHWRPNSGPNEIGQVSPSNDLCGLLVEEYGLRGRAAILRNETAAHLVDNTTIEQASLVALPTLAVETIARMDHLAQLRSLIAGVSTLCVGVSPGKGRIVGFLMKELDSEVLGFQVI